MHGEKRATKYPRHRLEAESHARPDIGVLVERLLVGDGLVSNCETGTLQVKTKSPTKDAAFLFDVKRGIANSPMRDQLAHDSEFKKSGLIGAVVFPSLPISSVWGPYNLFDEPFYG